ncbi:hypothetical protein L6164_026916 [Bauhinia variegata]|uniref:Uncharacterized protein n=1 Tax=Bauhinia variegata TaxID=167791 RepID=A0ACB9LSI7_BAUVA|nr:hypothetical protein L6164_026916 [Bauhinia variegata]
MTVPSAIPTDTKGRVLVIGATGFIGRYVAEASLSAGRPTYILVRPGAAPPSKAAIVKAFQDKGAIPIHGVINDKPLMEKILREHEIDIVISAVGGSSILDQLVLVEAMKSVKTVKRFLPSEFGHDVDRADPVEPGLAMYQEKRMIYGDGSVKAYFVHGTDIGKFTMMAVDDIRTVKKNVHFRPPANCYSINDLASMWEKKIGRTLPRVTISEDDLLAAAAANCIPQSIVASFTHDIFIKGCQVNFYDGAGDVEVTALYPSETFRSLEDCFEDFVVMIKDEDKEDKIERGKKGLPNPKPVVEALPVTAMC